MRRANHRSARLAWLVLLGACSSSRPSAAPVESVEASHRAGPGASAEGDDRPRQPATPQPAGGQPDATPRFSCSMHPSVSSSSPGTCPICGMDLVPAEVEPADDLPRVDLDCVGATCRVDQVRALLLAARGHRDPLIRSLAVAALPSDQLVVALHDAVGSVRLAAAIEVGRRRLPSARTALRTAWEDARDDPQGLARLAALDASAAIRDDRATAQLRPWLHDEDPIARLLAVVYADDQPALAGELRSVASRDPSRDVRDAAQSSLALLGDAGARAAVRRRTDSGAFAIQMKIDPQHTRPRLARLLAAPLPAAASAQDLILYSRAALVLLEAGDPEGRRAVHGLLANVEPAWELSLLQSLDLHAAREDLPVIVPRLASPDPMVRTEAAVSWTRIMGLVESAGALPPAP